MPTEASIAAAEALLDQALPADGGGDEAPEASDVVPAPGGTPAAGAASPQGADHSELHARLDELRQRRAARESKVQATAAETKAKAEREAIERDRAAVEAQKKQWAEVGKDPLKAFAALGLDPGEEFMRLSKAAQEANSPEARAKAALELAEATRKQFADYVAQQEAKAKEAEEARQQAEFDRELAAERSAAEDLVIAQIPTETVAIAKHYMGGDESKLRGSLNSIADDLRAEGQQPTLQLVVERFVLEVTRYDEFVRSAPGQASGAPQSPGGQPSKVSGSGHAGQVRTAPTPISNDLAAASASNPSRRKSLQERQREAEQLLSAPARATR
jgi:hypothetical protein